MAKFAVFAALLAAFIVLHASASTHTTVVTTTTANEENPTDMCQRAVRQMRMRRCMQYMQMGTPYAAEAASSNRRFGGDDDDDDLQEQCCKDLRRVSPLCRCEALRHMMRRMQEEYGMQEQMHQMRQVAEMLPQTCGAPSPRPCRIRAVSF